MFQKTDRFLNAHTAQKYEQQVLKNNVTTVGKILKPIPFGRLAQATRIAFHACKTFQYNLGWYRALKL